MPDHLSVPPPLRGALSQAMLYLNRNNPQDDDAEHTVRLNRLLALLAGMVVVGFTIWVGIDWG